MKSINLSTFIQSVFKIFCVLLIIACSKDQVKSTGTSLENKYNCIDERLEAKHIAISVKSHVVSFSRCLQHYIKFQKYKNFSISVCTELTVLSSGQVRNVSVFGIDKILPNDLKWCFEQEMWKMNFSKLQLAKLYQVKFPMSFEIKNQ